MRKTMLLLLAAMLMLAGFSASAEQVGLPAIPATLQLPDGEYAPILTPENLGQYETFIHSRGGTVASWTQMFKDQGIQMQAYDDANNRVLVVSAISDVDGQRYVDIDQQTPGIRSDYRREALDREGPMGAQGYRVESAEWRNFDHVGRFLMIKYRFSPGGDMQYRGFMRKSVKNGLTVTLDMRVTDGSITAGDNTALNKVFDTLAFTAASAPGVTLPVVISETKTPPAETNQPTFTIAGTTRPGVKISVVVGSFSSNEAQVYNAVADEKGQYEIEVTLNREDVFAVSLSATLEGMEPLERSYPVRYDKGLIPVNFTSQPLPETLTEDSYTLSGTTDNGVTVQLISNNSNRTVRTNRSGAFSFKVDTKQEGPYTIRLSFSKNNFEVRTFDYTVVKGSAPAITPVPSVAPGAAAAAQPGSNSLDALSPNYTDLVASAAQYAGQSLTYDGYLIETIPQTNGAELRMALRKTASGYADTIVLLVDRDPAIRPDVPIRVVGTLEGLGEGDDANLGYPRLKVTDIRAFPAATQQP